MKTETYKLYSRDFWIFSPNIIKIDPYNFELYRFKVGPFFETQCSSPSGLRPLCTKQRDARWPWPTGVPGRYRKPIYLPVSSVRQQYATLSRSCRYVSDKEHRQRKQEWEKPRQSDQ